MDSELLMRLESIKRGLETARADEDEPEDEDVVDGEIAGLILTAINALAAKQARLERALAAVDP